MIYKMYTNVVKNIKNIMKNTQKYKKIKTS